MFLALSVEAGGNLALAVFVVAKFLINALRETSVRELLIRGYSVGGMNMKR
jgi:hypothetical protein